MASTRSRAGRHRRGAAALAGALLLAAGAALAAGPAGPAPAAAPAGASAVIQVTLPTITAAPGSAVDVPLDLDQDISGLGVCSIEYRLPLDPAIISGASFWNQGVITTWGQPNTNVTGSFVAAVAAGFVPVSSHVQRLHRLELTLSPAASPGADMPLTLSILKFNEGSPAATVVSGLLRVRTTADVPAAGGVPLALPPVLPNPVVTRAQIAFSVPGGESGGGSARLAIYALDGRRVRTLVDGMVAPGPGSARWDARDDTGRSLAPGIYLCRLEWRGRHLERKLALVR